MAEKKVKFDILTVFIYILLVVISLIVIFPVIWN